MAGKYLFLDIDGVLNDHTAQVNGYCGIQHDKVLLLNKILEQEPEVEIIVSSAWRYLILNGSMTLRGFEYLLKIHGAKCKGRVTGHTREDKDVDEPRCIQIKEWLENHEHTHYVILDDLELNCPNHIRTESNVGLTEEIVFKVLEILK